MNIETAERRREEIQRLCAERGISITKYGAAWWLCGDGVDLIAVDLAWLQPADIRKRPAFER